MDQNELSPRGPNTESSATNDFNTPDTSSAGSYGATGGAASGSSLGAGSTSTSKDFDPSSTDNGAAFSDRVREIAGSAQHTLADVGSTVSEKANTMKSSVAEAMESGVNRLKNIDFDSLKASVEREVREHPARTLLMAVGVGYLVGRSFKK
jgi:hypothetical protein